MWKGLERHLVGKWDQRICLKRFLLKLAVYWEVALGASYGFLWRADAKVHSSEAHPLAPALFRG